VIVGSLFAGIGGLDWACETALGCSTAWQLDLTGADVRRRHWPDALQVEADVATVDPLDLPRIDVLAGGFSCKGLSVAGGMRVLGHPETRATYFGLLKFAGADPALLSWQEGDDKWGSGLRVEATRHGPEMVVIENVPAMLTHMREPMERHFDAIGYGLTWVRCGARDASAPHIRRRVFVVGVRGGRAGGVIDAPDGGRWTPERDERTWSTPRVTDGTRGATPARPSVNGSPFTEQLAGAVRTWASVKSADAWSPGPSSGNGTREGTDGLACQVRPWATPAARDYRTGELADRVGSEALNQQATDYPRSPFGSRLSPDWTETLQGFPVGWTLPTGPRLEVDPSPRWPRCRYPATWDRSQLWPGYDWEPARTLPDGPPCPGRPARIRALGNAVCPQQGALAIRKALETPAQPSLLTWRPT